MSGIPPIQSYTQTNSVKRTHLKTELTGLIAGVGIASTMASGFTKNKSFKRQHKNIAVATAIITVLHVLVTKLGSSKKQ